MVLIVLLSLNNNKNGQNNEGRLLFDKGSTNREKMGAKRLIKRVSEQEIVCGKYESLTKNIDNCGLTKRKSGSGCPRSLRTADNVSMIQDMMCSQDHAPCSHINPRKIQERIEHCNLA